MAVPTSWATASVSVSVIAMPWTWGSCRMTLHLAKFFSFGLAVNFFNSLRSIVNVTRCPIVLNEKQHRKEAQLAQDECISSTEYTASDSQFSSVFSSSSGSVLNRPCPPPYPSNVWKVTQKSMLSTHATRKLIQ